MRILLRIFSLLVVLVIGTLLMIMIFTSPEGMKPMEIEEIAPIEEEFVDEEDNGLPRLILLEPKGEVQDTRTIYQSYISSAKWSLEIKEDIKQLNQSSATFDSKYFQIGGAILSAWQQVRNVQFNDISKEDYDLLDSVFENTFSLLEEKNFEGAVVELSKLDGKQEEYLETLRNLN